MILVSYDHTKCECCKECHTIAARCLYIFIQRKSRLQTVIVFHCTTVRNPAQDDQKKLARTLKYLMAIRFLPLILAISKSGVIEWWLGASFVVHEDMKSRSDL